MSKKKYKQTKASKAKEPLVTYGEGDKRIVFFKSFEEENEWTHRNFASLSYNERLSRLHTMLLSFYSKELKQHPSSGTNIYFD